MIKGTLTLCY